MELKTILSKCDHTLLAQTATWEEIKAICDDGMKYHTASVCIPASFVKQAKAYVGEKLPICTVIGFPNGYDTTAAKCFMASDAVDNGADEVDMALASAERIATLPGCYYRYLRRRQGSLTFVKDRFPFAALEAYGAVEEALRARGLWHAFARNFIEVFVARMLADLKSLREDENLKSAYPRVRERFRVFASEGRLDENLALPSRELLM